MAGKGISGTGITALAGGSLLLWSSLTGRKWSAVFLELLKGKQPSNVADYPITAASASASHTAMPTATGGGGASADFGGGTRHCASTFGGPGDPGTGSHGYHGDNLNGTMAFAELKMGMALGNLPYRTQARITYNGKSVIATKLDIGLGGKGCGGFSRDVDLWWETAQALGFSGLGVVTFERL